MLNKVVNFLSSIKNIALRGFKFLGRFISISFDFVASWWRAIVFIFIALIFLYYPIGATLINNIDTNTNYNFSAPEDSKQSQTVNIMAHIISREVKQKTWTPNLPFFFPSAVLDNMPNFQLGMFDALADTSSSFSTVFSSETKMKHISTLLAYDGRIWMFSPESKNIATSANKIYLEAKKELIKFNSSLSEGEDVFVKRPQDLAFILKQVEQNINKSISDIEKHINETKGSYSDTKSDDLFFYTKGKLYGYYLLLNALGQDYRETIVASDIYSRWTIITKTLADASELNPLIIRSGSLDSSFVPNHLNVLSSYAMKANYNIQKANINLGATALVRNLEITTGIVTDDN